MKELVAYLKGFAGLGLLFVTAIFVIIGFFFVGGTFFIVVAEFLEPLEGLGVAAVIGLIFIVGGLCCTWIAVKLFQGDNPRMVDLRCFLGGYACLVASTISVLFGIAYLVPDTDVEGIGGLPFITAGACWLLATVMLFRGHRTPVSHLGRFFAGNAKIILSLVLFSLAYEYYFEDSRYVLASIGVIAGTSWLCNGAANLFVENEADRKKEDGEASEQEESASKPAEANSDKN